MLDYTTLTFPPAPAGRPYVFLNMVTSLDGRAVVDGTEVGLGSDTDRRLMREIRMHADLVLVGGGTMRVSGASSRLASPRLEALRVARGKPPLPVSAVLTASGDIPLRGAFFEATDFRAIVYLGSGCSPGRRAALEAMGREVVEVPAGRPAPAVLDHARRTLGADYLLLEGGPLVNAIFLAEDVVDEVFLTVGPVIVGGDGQPIVKSGDALARRLRPMTLVSCLQEPETGEVFLRYRRRR